MPYPPNTQKPYQGGDLFQGCLRDLDTNLLFFSFLSCAFEPYIPHVVHHSLTHEKHQSYYDVSEQNHLLVVTDRSDGSKKTVDQVDKEKYWCARNFVAGNLFSETHSTLCDHVSIIAARAPGQNSEVVQK